MLSKARKLSLAISNPSIFTSRNRYLFILSHMRSRSTVLSHVLGSHPEIVGYSELHRRYDSRLDLFKMRLELYSETKRDLSNKYLLDKLLHNETAIADALLAEIRPKVIIALREPEATLKSIIQMGHRTGVHWYKDPQWAADYYCSRLERLSTYVRTLADEFFYLQADELVEDTEAVLFRLGQWLGLQSPLSANYKQFANTGQRHYGDSSENIRAGVIRKTGEHRNIELPPAVLERADAAFHRCHLQIAGYAAASALSKSA